MRRLRRMSRVCSLPLSVMRLSLSERETGGASEKESENESESENERQGGREREQERVNKKREGRIKGI